VTRKLTAKFVEEWKKNHPEGTVINRDLSATVLPQITDDWGATYLEESKLTPMQRSYLSVSDKLIAEVEASDTIVIGAPMYNHTISAPLKAWIDQVVRMGKTMRYGADGPRGLLKDKKVVVVTARGGAYEKGSATEAFDFQAPYLRHVLGAIGLTDVTFIHAEKQGRPDAEMAVVAATAQISRVVREQKHAVTQTQTTQ